MADGAEMENKRPKYSSNKISKTTRKVTMTCNRCVSDKFNKIHIEKLKALLFIVIFSRTLLLNCS